MKQKYVIKNSVNEAEKIQAQKLQYFFQDIKLVSKGGQAHYFDQQIIQLIWDNFRANNSFMNKNFKNLFAQSGRQGGFSFERQLSGIIETVMKEVAEEDFEFDKNQVLLGAERGTTINYEELDLSDKEVQKFLEKIGTKTQRYIENDLTGTKLKQYYLPEVDGKIDVRGYEINVRADANPKMIEIYNLLKDATFSAKNYDSMTYDQKIGELVQATGRNILHLGKSNVFRSIYGSLKEYNDDPQVNKSAIFAGYNSILKGNTTVATHFYHLRYMYELMGTGILYNGKSYGKVKFLIFNDPHDNVYVKSTSELFADVIKESLDHTQPWNKGIVISKEKFY